MIVSKLFIYPVKSLGGISLTSAVITDRGFQYDRRWLLVNQDGRFLTQRELPEMALLQVSIEDHHLMIRHKQKTYPPLIIPFQQEHNEVQTVTIWTDICQAVYAGQAAAEWFSSLLSVKCSLVYMPEQSKRNVDPVYARNKEITNFSDGYPFMIIGQASLDDLNSRLTDPCP